MARFLLRVGGRLVVSALGMLWGVARARDRGVNYDLAWCLASACCVYVCATYVLRQHSWLEILGWVSGCSQWCSCRSWNRWTAGPTFSSEAAGSVAAAALSRHNLCMVT